MNAVKILNEESVKKGNSIPLSISFFNNEFNGIEETMLLLRGNFEDGKFFISKTGRDLLMQTVLKNKKISEKIFDFVEEHCSGDPEQLWESTRQFENCRVIEGFFGRFALPWDLPCAL